MPSINMTQNIFDQMPDSTRFNEQDAHVIHSYHDLLSTLEDDLVTGFYDLLYNTPATQKILAQDERSHREQTLRHWWQKTITSDFDASYWEWQTFVGLVHIKQKVSNPMMIAMWGWILATLRQSLKPQLPAEQLDNLMLAFEKLAFTIQALIVESFLQNYVKAIEKATGFNNALIDRMVSLQIDEMIQNNRTP